VSAGYPRQAVCWFGGEVWLVPQYGHGTGDGVADRLGKADAHEPRPAIRAGALAASSLLVSGAGLFLGDAPNGLREVNLRLTQRL
jgi:hypothetical protein